MIHPSPDQVRWTGLAAMVGGVLGLERWGFRPNSAALLLLTIGAFSGYWPPLLDFSFVAFILPGLLLLILGSPLLGPGNLGGPASRRASAPAC